MASNLQISTLQPYNGEVATSKGSFSPGKASTSLFSNIEPNIILNDIQNNVSQQSDFTHQARTPHINP